MSGDTHATPGSRLNMAPNLADSDDFYDELLRAHEGASDEQSEAFNARLILILCNHIGDRQVIREALAVARAAAPAPDTSDR